MGASRSWSPPSCRRARTVTKPGCRTDAICSFILRAGTKYRAGGCELRRQENGDIVIGNRSGIKLLYRGGRLIEISFRGMKLEFIYRNGAIDALKNNGRVVFNVERKPGNIVFRGKQPQPTWSFLLTKKEEKNSLERLSAVLKDGRETRTFSYSQPTLQTSAIDIVDLDKQLHPCLRYSTGRGPVGDRVASAGHNMVLPGRGNMAPPDAAGRMETQRPNRQGNVGMRRWLHG